MNKNFKKNCEIYRKLVKIIENDKYFDLIHKIYKNSTKLLKYKIYINQTLITSSVVIIIFNFISCDSIGTESTSCKG